MKLLNLSEKNFTQAEEVQRRDQQLLQGQLLQQNLELREAHQKSLREMEELKLDHRSSTFDADCKTMNGEDLRHQFVAFQCQILKYLMRRLLQHAEQTQSSIIRPVQKEESVWNGTKMPRSRTVSFASGVFFRQIAYFIYDNFQVIWEKSATRFCREVWTDLFTSLPFEMMIPTGIRFF